MRIFAVLFAMSARRRILPVRVQLSYSEGERAGWIQKFSSKGWLCKTWEGNWRWWSMPARCPRSFSYGLGRCNRRTDQQGDGQTVSLHYEEKVGIPTSCFARPGTT